MLPVMMNNNPSSPSRAPSSWPRCEPVSPPLREHRPRPRVSLCTRSNIKGPPPCDDNDDDIGDLAKRRSGKQREQQEKEAREKHLETVQPTPQVQRLRPGLRSILPFAALFSNCQSATFARAHTRTRTHTQTTLLCGLTTLAAQASMVG